MTHSEKKSENGRLPNKEMEILILSPSNLLSKGWVTFTFALAIECLGNYIKLFEREGEGVK